MKGIPGRRNQTVKNKISEGNCQGQGTKKTKQKNKTLSNARQEGFKRVVNRSKVLQFSSVQLLSRV